MPGRLFPILLAALLVPACSGPATTGRSVFHFSVGEQEYEVISLSLASGEGVNYLLQRENDHVVFRAKDEDQDGHIDQVLMGNLSVHHADSLYALGIEEAKRRGQFARREASRVYMVTRPDGVYSVRSVLVGAGDWYNAFTLTDPTGERSIFLMDSDADGVLDESGLDEADMREWQTLYRDVLDQGIREGRVERTTSGYLVR